jgi:hypothetical protein
LTIHSTLSLINNFLHQYELILPGSYPTSTASAGGREQPRSRLSTTSQMNLGKALGGPPTGSTSRRHSVNGAGGAGHPVSQSAHPVSQSGTRSSRSLSQSAAGPGPQRRPSRTSGNSNSMSLTPNKRASITNTNGRASVTNGRPSLTGSNGRPSLTLQRSSITTNRSSESASSSASPQKQVSDNI